MFREGLRLYSDFIRLGFDFFLMALPVIRVLADSVEKLLGVLYNSAPLIYESGVLLNVVRKPILHLIVDALNQFLLFQSVVFDVGEVAFWCLHQPEEDTGSLFEAEDKLVHMPILMHVAQSRVCLEDHDKFGTWMQFLLNVRFHNVLEYFFVGEGQEVTVV